MGREEKNNFEMENQHMAADSAMQMSNYNAQMSRMEAEVKAVREQNQQLLDQVRDKRQLQTRLDEVENKWHAAETELAIKNSVTSKLKDAFALSGAKNSKTDKAIQELANELMGQVQEKEEQLTHARTEKKLWAQKLGEMQLELQKVTQERDELLLDGDDGQSVSTWTTRLDEASVSPFTQFKK